MSEDSKDKPGSIEQRSGAKPEAPRLGRRLFIFRAGAFLTGTTALTVANTQSARAQGVTDQDPSDPEGQGRGGGTGVTDQDPSDPEGQGRGGGGRGGGGGVTDRDMNPGDPAGQGRGGGNGATDRDPDPPAGDQPGRGRGTNR